MNSLKAPAVVPGPIMLGGGPTVIGGRGTTVIDGGDRVIVDGSDRVINDGVIDGPNRVIVDRRDNDVVVTRSASPKWTERMLRQICTEMGSRAALCRTPRSGKVIKEKAILGTVSQAIRIGATLIVSPSTICVT